MGTDIHFVIEKREDLEVMGKIQSKWIGIYASDAAKRPMGWKFEPVCDPDGFVRREFCRIFEMSVRDYRFFGRLGLNDGSYKEKFLPEDASELSRHYDMDCHSHGCCSVDHFIGKFLDTEDQDRISEFMLYMSVCVHPRRDNYRVVYYFDN
jgi:hypothetical protein